VFLSPFYTTTPGEKGTWAGAERLLRNVLCMSIAAKYFMRYIRPTGARCFAWSSPQYSSVAQQKPQASYAGFQ